MRAMKRPPPQVHAFLICDSAFQQLESGKWCIIGTFDAVYTNELPCRFPPFHVFVSLGDFMGDATVMVVMRDDVGEVVYAVRGQIPPIPGSSPLSHFELALPFPGVEFRRAGSHSLELCADEQVLAVRSLRVHMNTNAETGGPSGEEGPESP